MGFVVTMTTLLATDVYFRDVVQNIKCRPRNTPPASESSRSLLHTVLNEIPFIQENTRRIMDATHILYVAIIIAGTSSQNLMNIAAKDMETIPTNSIAMVLIILFSKTTYYLQWIGIFDYHMSRHSNKSIQHIIINHLFS